MRVLVAIDGSERAGVAVDLVADVAWPAGTEILVAEAVESGAGLFGGPWAVGRGPWAGKLPWSRHTRSKRSCVAPRS